MFLFELLISHLRFSRIDQTDLEHFSACAFSDLFVFSISKVLTWQQSSPTTEFVFSLISFQQSGVTRVKNNWFRRSVTFPLVLTSIIILTKMLTTMVQYHVRCKSFWNRKHSVLQWGARMYKLVNPGISATTIRDLFHMRCDMLRTMWCTVLTVVFSGRRVVVTKVCQISKWPLHLVFTWADCYIYGKMHGLGVPPLPALDNASAKWYV